MKSPQASLVAFVALSLLVGAAQAGEPAPTPTVADAPGGLPADVASLLRMLADAPATQLAALADAPTIPRDRSIPGALRIKRVSAGPDGKSRLDVIELPVVAGEPGRSITSRVYATDVELGYGTPGNFIDWHRVTTPRFWILLQGAFDFGTGDGKVHRLVAGDIVLAADTTGQGHTSRNVGDVPSFVLTVRLPAEDSLKPKPNPAPGTSAMPAMPAK